VFEAFGRPRLASGGQPNHADDQFLLAPDLIFIRGGTCREAAGVVRLSFHEAHAIPLPFSSDTTSAAAIDDKQGFATGMRLKLKER